MTVKIEIYGESASDALADLKELTAALLASTVMHGAQANLALAAAAQLLPTPLSPIMPELEVAAPVEAAPPPPPPAPTEANGTAVATSDASVQTDANGVAFDPALHTGTLKKDGTWRMKKGAADAEAAPPPPPPSAGPAVEEDDEFAAFATAEAAPAAPVARKWTDADLSKLCNQGASKDGNPDRVKAIIAKYVPANEVQHSRNIPAGVREDFAQELESTIGIEYAG